MIARAIARITLAATGVLLLAVPPLAAQRGAVPAADTAVADTAGATGPASAPVVLAQDTLFHIYTRLGPFSAAERAEAVRKRIRQLSNDPLARHDTVRILTGETSSDVLTGDVVVLTVTDADANAAGVPRDSLAHRYARAVGRVLGEQSFVARLKVIGLGLLFALLATLATVAAFRGVNRIFPQVVAFVERGRRTWMPALRVQHLELISANRITNLVLAAIRLVRVVVLALLLYSAIPLILSFFPWTRRYADQLFGYILTPFANIWAGFIHYIPNVFALGAIVLVTWYLLKLIRPVFEEIERGAITFEGFYPDWAMPTYNLVRALVIVFAAIAAWPYIPGSGTAAFQGVSVFLGLLLSLGSAAAIGNIVGGVVLIYMRPFRVGDRVKIADTVGDVVEKSLLVTRVRTIKNVDITIPNSMVLGSHITNFSSSAQEHGLILNTTVTIGYDVPWPQVHELLIAAALDTPEVLAEPRPFVFQTSLGDFSVAYELNAYTDQPNRMSAIYSALHANIQNRFNEAGVEIMSPQFHALRDGNSVTIPEKHLPPGYQAPSFRVDLGNR